MKWLKFVIIMTVFCVVIGEDNNEEDMSQGNERDNREIDREGWRAVDTFQEGNLDWIPQDQIQKQSEEQVPKRRRLRKRKRRPPMISLTDEFNPDESLVNRAQPLRRRVRPQNLEHIPEPWEEMTDEAIRKPNVRRRVTPPYQSPEDSIDGDEQINISPMDVTIRFEEEIPDITQEQLKSNKETIQVFSDRNNNENEEPIVQTTANLKSVLKQTGGGLSLSEILQQKNLSLTELLMGNQRAISALTERQQEVTESAIDIKTTDFDTESTRYKRLPPSIGLRKQVNRNYEQQGESLETLSTKEMLEAQRKRLALLHGHKDNKLFSSVTKYDVITEPTTERRIFVPSHPKYYTSLNFKPDFNLYNEQTTEPLPQPTIREEISTTSTTTPKPVQNSKRMYLKPKLNGLPITNAKISKITPKPIIKLEENEAENYPIPFNFPKPIKINISDISGFATENNKNLIEEQTDKKDEPLRVSIDLETFMEKTTKKVEPERYSYTKATTLKVEEPMTTTEPLMEKVTYVTAKEEIMEILKDPFSREKLSRILENRNMTVQELVEQRERGSSQLHLADIFHNKTREPEPKEEPSIGHINSEYFNSFPRFGRQQKSRAFDDHYSNQQSIISTEMVTTITEKTTSTIKPKEAYSVTSFPTVKIEGNKDIKEKANSFLWPNIYPDSFPEVHENNYKKSDEELVDPFKFSSETYSEEEVQRVEDIENTLSLASNEKPNVHDEASFQEEVLINIPSGVKSAIFVSLAIIGLSIIVFSTILLVFRWTQRQKRKLNYCNSLSSKIKSPILIQRRPVNAIKSFMNETLGRKKNYYKSNVQSMSDDLWENSRRPSF